jgi:hypothetical protein
LLHNVTAESATEDERLHEMGLLGMLFRCWARSLPVLLSKLGANHQFNILLLTKFHSPFIYVALPLRYFLHLDPIRYLVAEILTRPLDLRWNVCQRKSWCRSRVYGSVKQVKYRKGCVLFFFVLPQLIPMSAQSSPTFTYDDRIK